MPITETVQRICFFPSNLNAEFCGLFDHKPTNVLRKNWPLLLLLFAFFLAESG